MVRAHRRTTKRAFANDNTRSIFEGTPKYCVERSAHRFSVTGIGLGFRYPLELLNWLSITKTAVFVLLLLLTVFIRKMALLRALVTVLLTLQMAMGAFGAIVSSSAWRLGISGIESPFVRAMLGVQFVRVAVTLAVLYSGLWQQCFRFT
jgi:hypothetical protein